jgi:hypothetical protein
MKDTAECHINKSHTNLLELEERVRSKSAFAYVSKRVCSLGVLDSRRFHQFFDFDIYENEKFAQR